MAEYRFKLKGDITVHVKTAPAAHDHRFLATVEDAHHDTLGSGRAFDEPTAIGLAILESRQAFEVCEACGRTVYKGGLEEDGRGMRVCGDCWGAM